ncbi:radical SAM protein [Pseudodesulfovibrio piezophilus]|uniref:Radical SAM domain protein n=1 Tax=Pseudodesulfovibrio piezophilus (strain DSM 21447 / JCM 15486 / C1TLV30) TaxID=1322246 RepID=M1WRJ0_PSEP2|nr:radical SAM protein [Pseudodesulfovibrio piezophilus]CCH49584.1 Radical SAM domain protein [Pseudodesulfovibrio piezophilus C1TLV30]
MAYKYVFGPVLSGRLGRSLGLDLLGGRICSMDCVYCEVGATRDLTLFRKPYVPASDILGELAAWKDEGLAPPDMITLGGLGEPSLNSEMPAVIAGARELFPDTDVAVLTNSTLMTDPSVRTELALADVILPSLDSLVKTEFDAVNRPCAGVDPMDVAHGLMAFRQGFKGKIFLEILLVEGVNDTDANLAKLTEFCKRLTPDRVDVVTTTRPGTVRGTRPVDGAILSRWRMQLERGKEKNCPTATSNLEALSLERVTALVGASLVRRPQTVPQLAGALNVDQTMVRQAVEALVKMGDVVSREDRGETFFHGTGHVLEG